MLAKISVKLLKHNRLNINYIRKGVIGGLFLLINR